MRYSWDDEQQMAKVTVKQTQEVTELTPVFVTPVEIAFMVEDAVDRREKSEGDAASFRVTIERRSRPSTSRWHTGRSRCASIRAAGCSRRWISSVPATCCATSLLTIPTCWGGSRRRRRWDAGR